MEAIIDILAMICILIAMIGVVYVGIAQMKNDKLYKEAMKKYLGGNKNE